MRRYKICLCDSPCHRVLQQPYPLEILHSCPLLSTSPGELLPYPQMNWKKLNRYPLVLLRFFQPDPK